jgi:hypothetical protein
VRSCARRGKRGASTEATSSFFQTDVELVVAQEGTKDSRHTISFLQVLTFAGRVGLHIVVLGHHCRVKGFRSTNVEYSSENEMNHVRKGVHRHGDGTFMFFG